MRFWDSSALIPLIVRETASDRLEARRAQDPGILVWWATMVECGAAAARYERQPNADLAALRDARSRLRTLAQSWTEVPASVDVRETAMRLVRLHDLRAGDSLQLAAALVASELQPKNLEFVTLDRRLAEAADREGFRVLG